VLNKRIMEAERLEYSPAEKLKILKTLSHFSSDDHIKILEDDIFWKNKFKLDIEFAKIKNGTAQFISFDEIDEFFKKKNYF
jgi:hypothetical protein